MLPELLEIPKRCTDPRLNDVFNFKHLFKYFSHITGWDVNAGLLSELCSFWERPFPCGEDWNPLGFLGLSLGASLPHNA